MVMELWQILCFLCFCTTYSRSSSDIYNVIESQSFDKVKASKPLVVISFVKAKPYDELFQKNFVKAGNYLKDFGVHFGTVDCVTDAVPEYCKKTEATNHVYFFSHGDFLTNMPTDTLFDMDAIVSNVLHMLLLVDVPIMSEDSELKMLEDKHRGKKDIVFGYIPAVGTQADRAFVEGAFAYRQQFAFAMTTTQTMAVGKKERSTSLIEDPVPEVWTLQCSVAGPSEPCPQAKYKGPITVDGMALMLKTLQLPGLVDVTSKGQVIPYEEHGIPAIYAVTDPANHKKALAVAMETRNMFRGNLGLVVIDKNNLSDDRLMPSADTECKPACFLLSDHSQQIHSIDGAHEADDLKVYLEMNNDLVFGHLEYPATGGMSEEEDGEEGEEDFFEDLPEQERQDDRVQAATLHLRLAIEPEEIRVPSLTDKTFPEFTAQSQLTTVLFTIRWNPMCLAFLEPFESAAQNIASFLQTSEGSPPLARVDCYDWPDVCEKNNITAWPTVKMYRDQSSIATYTGTLDEENILKAHMLNALPNPVEIDTVDNLKGFTEGANPSPSWMKKYLNGVTLAVIPEESSKEKSTFLQVAQELTGKHLLGLCTGQCAKQVRASGSSFEGSLPAVVVYKWNDAHQPKVTFDRALTVDNLMKFITESSLPVLPELTPASMPTLMAKQKPFVILFNGGNPISTKAADSVREIAAEGSYNQFVFGQLDISSEDSIGMSTLTTYGFLPLTDEATVVIVDHGAGAVCRYPHGKESSVLSIKTWLKAALDGQKPCSEMRALVDREWTPLVPPYDYLELIENEERSVGSGRRGLGTNPEPTDIPEGGESVEKDLGTSPEDRPEPVDVPVKIQTQHTEL